jgi:hypothetical protein
MAATVIPFPRPTQTAEPPDTDQLVTKIRDLAKDSENLHMDHPHFRQRLAQRKITMRQVLDVLRNGCGSGQPILDEWGDWRVKMRRKSAGRRVQVVVAVKERQLDLITVI